MTVRELQALLANCDPESVVVMSDPHSRWYALQSRVREVPGVLVDDDQGIKEYKPWRQWQHNQPDPPPGQMKIVMLD